MFKRCQRQSGTRRIIPSFARFQRVEDAGRKGIAGSDAIDDPRNCERLGLEPAIARIDARSEEVSISIADVPRGGSDRF